jgi:hypothetical protein
MESMDQLRFEELLYDDGYFKEWDAVPYVNGQNLIERVAEIEASAAKAEGARSAPRRGLAARDVFAPAPILGDPDPAKTPGKRTVLRCECGEIGCGDLFAEIILGETSVVWRNFTNPHHPEWSFERLGPFEFARDEYEAAFRRSAAEGSAD